MIDLIGHIEYLILRHDCVVIPGIGALIAHRTPARIEPETGIMFPPRRSLSFNAAITHNDGLLATSVARKEGIPYEAALSAVTEKVNEMQSLVQSQGELAIGRIGVLKHTNDDRSTYLFDPFTTTNISPSLTGLAPINIRTLAELSDDSANTPAVAKKQTVYTSMRHSFAKIAALITMVLTLGFILSTPIIDDKANRASMGIEISSPSIDIYSPSFDENPPIDLNIAFPDPEDAFALFQPQSDTIRPQDARLNPEDRYFLIVASLPSKDLAEEYIRDHSGPDSLGVLEVDGRFRVYAASGATYSEAGAYNKSGRYPDAWVCKR